MKPLKEIADLKLCVVDHGTFAPVAHRLARDCKEVFYHMPNGESSKTFANLFRGYGHKDVTWCDDIWPIKNEIDAFVFPDIGDGGLQLELESQGFPVWGSKMACEQEEGRGVWLDTCKELGLPMPKTHVITGLAALKAFFDEHEGETYHVKISRFRGDMETWKACEPAQIRNKIDSLRPKFGPFQDGIKFYVQEPVDTEIEGGADTYFVDGQYPDKIILGYERKGESYFATWKDRKDMPPEIWKPSEIIAPLLKSYGYCNTVSTEIRYDPKKDKSFLLDPCLRFPSPAGEEELEMYKNITEIIYLGARGQMVQPDMAAKFCGEAVIAYSGDRDGWKSIRIPEEVRQWVKLYACGYEDGAYHFPPAQEPEAIGCIVALGDTPDEVLANLKDIRDALKDSSVDIKIEPIASLFEEIEKAEEVGIPFSEEHEVPDPAEAITD